MSVKRYEKDALSQLGSLARISIGEVSIFVASYKQGLARASCRIRLDNAEVRR